MQAILNGNELKPFTRALTCLSKYGDELILHATPNTITLAAKNSALSAYCSVKYSPAFFHKYKLGKKTGGTGASTSTSGSGQDITCQLLTKSLLSILRHRNTEKTAEKCELTIVDGAHMTAEEDGDSLESRLLVRLHCRHGVVKTHRLLLNTVTDHYVPRLFETTLENKICVRPRTIKEIVEHFPSARGSKSDPQLIWRFDDGEVRVKSVEAGVDSKGKVQLATELTVGAGEFDTFEVHSSSITIGFHLREFNATIALAESLTVPLDIRFTEPSEPLYIHADADDCQMLFIISTFLVRGEEPPSDEVRSARAPSASAAAASNTRKRGRDEDDACSSERGDNRFGTAMSHRSEAKKSARVVSRTPSGVAFASNAGQHEQVRVRAPTSAPSLERSKTLHSQRDAPPPPSQSQPLFLASQVSAAELDMIRSSGLGIEDMDAEEFAAMLDGDGDLEEELGLGQMQLVPATASETTGPDVRASASPSVDGDTNINGGKKSNNPARPPTNTVCPSSETEEDEMEYDSLVLGDDNFRNFDDDDGSGRGRGRDNATGEFGPTQDPGLGHSSGPSSRWREESVPVMAGSAKDDSQKAYRALFED